VHDNAKAPAVFLDRDGTIIEQVHYLGDPDLVRLIDGAAAALAGLRRAGYRLVVVTNQSAIGRGTITIEQYESVVERMAEQLNSRGATIDAVYHCPHAPSSKDRTTIDHPDRKPGPGMLLRAAADLDLDLSRSWMIGDMLSDALAGRNAGLHRTILVRTGLAARADETHPSVDHAADSLAEAARLILASDVAVAHPIPEKERP